MIPFPPSRLDSLAKIVESGGDLTQDDVDRAAFLQAVDCVNVGQAFVEESMKRNADQIELFRQL